MRDWIRTRFAQTPIGWAACTLPVLVGLAVALVGLSYVLATLLLLLAVAAPVLALFMRFVQRQKSVDARYKAIIDQASDGIVIVDAETQALLYSNAAFLTRLGYTADDVQALTVRDIFIDDSEIAEAAQARLRDVHSQMASNMPLRCKDGSRIDMEVRCNALDVDGRDLHAYVTHDVSLRRKIEQQLIENQNRLDRMAHHDQLTGLPNRHYLAAFLPDAIAAARAASSMLGVVFLDLDRFKHINSSTSMILAAMKPATNCFRKSRPACDPWCANPT